MVPIKLGRRRLGPRSRRAASFKRPKLHSPAAVVVNYGLIDKKIPAN